MLFFLPRFYCVPSFSTHSYLDTKKQMLKSRHAKVDNAKGFIKDLA